MGDGTPSASVQWSGRGQFAFVVYPEVAKYMLIGQGEPDAWSTPALHLDGSVLDGDRNGVFTGKKKLDWATARTWSDNYGTSLLDYVVVLPQNEIPVAGQRRLVLQYESTAGLKPLSLELPPGTEGVALVNAGPSLTEVLLRSEGKHKSVARVEDSQYADRLAVKAGSIRLEG